MGAENLEYEKVLVSIELIPAIAEDLKEVDHYKYIGPNQPSKKVMRLRNGLPYWLLNPRTGAIEPFHYLLTDRTNPKTIAKYLEDGTIFIAKDPFKH